MTLQRQDPWLAHQSVRPAEAGRPAGNAPQGATRASPPGPRSTPKAAEKRRSLDPIRSHPSPGRPTAGGGGPHPIIRNRGPVSVRTEPTPYREENTDVRRNDRRRTRRRSSRIWPIEAGFGLTLLQASKLVKHLEDKWGVSAAAPVAVAAGPAGGGGGDDGGRRGENLLRRHPRRPLATRRSRSSRRSARSPAWASKRPRSWSTASRSPSRKAVSKEEAEDHQGSRSKPPAAASRSTEGAELFAHDPCVPIDHADVPGVQKWGAPGPSRHAI